MSWKNLFTLNIKQLSWNGQHTIVNSFIGKIGSKSLMENNKSYILSSIFGSYLVHKNPTAKAVGVSELMINTV